MSTITIKVSRVRVAGNTRDSLDNTNIQELADSMEKQGLLNPITVRPDADEDDAYELICGARRLQAAKMLDWDEIEATVKFVTDAEIPFIQLIENAQREDLTPLNEGDVFKEMNDRNIPIAEIAAGIGKSESYVIQRLSLTKLSPMGREAVTVGGLGISAARIICRFPEPVQDSMLKNIIINQKEGERWDFKPLRDLATLAQQYERNLLEAPFDITSETLCPVAGSCIACPKRSGHMKSLFPELIDKEDVCHDGDCFSNKYNLQVELLVAQQEALGRKVELVAEHYPFGLLPTKYNNKIKYGWQYKVADEGVETNMVGIMICPNSKYNRYDILFLKTEEEEKEAPYHEERHSNTQGVSVLTSDPVAAAKKRYVRTILPTLPMHLCATVWDKLPRQFMTILVYKLLASLAHEELAALIKHYRWKYDVDLEELDNYEYAPTLLRNNIPAMTDTDFNEMFLIVTSQYIARNTMSNYSNEFDDQEFVYENLMDFLKASKIENEEELMNIENELGISL